MSKLKILLFALIYALTIVFSPFALGGANAQSACKGQSSSACSSSSKCAWMKGFILSDGVKVAAHCWKKAISESSSSSSSNFSKKTDSKRPALVAGAQVVKKHVWEFRESSIGIDYKNLAPYPVNAILSQAEEEWLGNTTKLFGLDKASRYWRGMSKGVASGLLSDSMVSRLCTFTPKMLSNLAAGLDPFDSKYGLLQSQASTLVLSKISAAVDEDTDFNC